MTGKTTDLVCLEPQQFLVVIFSNVKVILDLQHNLWLLTLRGELGLSLKMTNGAKRVLDAGTGTGIWAVGYGMRPLSDTMQDQCH